MLGAILGAFVGAPGTALVSMLLGINAGCISFGVHKVLSELAKARGRRRVIIVDVGGKQRAALIRELSAQGLLFYFEIGDRSRLEELLDSNKASRIALAIVDENSLSSITYDQVLFRARLGGVPFIRYQHLLAMLSLRIDLRFITAWSLLEGGNFGSVITPYYQKLKTFIEPALAVLLALALSPFFACIALILKLEGSGPVLFRQTRLGKLGTPFTLFKFRSMRVDAEKDGAAWSSDNDSRVTFLGRFLRRTRLDELPQLINITRGEMGFIGPRPERPEFYETITSVEPLFPMRLLTKPGLTGWAQVSAGYANSIEGSQRKLEFDLYYILYASLRLDIIIGIMTIVKCFAGDKAEETFSHYSRTPLAQSALRATQISTVWR